jgi:large subunit ribosomal protein L19e
MKVERAREHAATLLKVGKKKVWIDPKQLDKVSEAVTKDDIRTLISEGIIRKKHEPEQSRGRARILREKKKKKRKRGPSKRRGTRKARSKDKEQWVKNVRSQRAKLRELKEKRPEAVKLIGYRKLYRMIKGGYFKGKHALERYVAETYEKLKARKKSKSEKE